MTKGMLSLKISWIIFLRMRSSVLTLHRYFLPHRPTDGINIFPRSFLFFSENRTKRNPFVCHQLQMKTIY